jgi:hypothetical protein
MSEAQLMHVEKMKRGEIEFSGKISENQKSDWKDEFVLITISSPLFLLAYSVFAEDEKMQQKDGYVFSKITRNALVDCWLMGFRGGCHLRT